MSKSRFSTRRRLIGVLAVVGSGVIIPQFVDACDGRLVNLTYYIDPCGTFLANCAPGSFAANNSQLGNPCIDPECTVPGGCGTGNPPLGTVRPLCP